MSDEVNGSGPAPQRTAGGADHGDRRNGSAARGYGGHAARTPGDRRGYAAKPLVRLPPPKNPGPAGTAPAGSSSTTS
jgi:hypothetical protein